MNKLRLTAAALLVAASLTSAFQAPAQALSYCVDQYNRCIAAGADPEYCQCRMYICQGMYCP